MKVFLPTCILNTSSDISGSSRKIRLKPREAFRMRSKNDEKMKIFENLKFDQKLIGTGLRRILLLYESPGR